MQLAQIGLGVGSAAFPPLAVAQFGLGAIQTITALKQLNELKRERVAKYTDNLAPLQENVNMWKGRSEEGLPSSFIDLARGENARQTASTFRRIQDVSGGQLGSSFARVAAMDRIRLGLNLAQMSDSARREAMGQLARSREGMVNQLNLQTSADRNYRMMREQSMGGALKAGTQNLTQAIDYGLPNIFPGGFSSGPGAVSSTIPADVSMSNPGQLTPPLPTGDPLNIKSNPYISYYQ